MSKIIFIKASYRVNCVIFGVRNMMNYVPTLSETSLTTPFGIAKYFYKYCFTLPFVTH